MSAIAAVSKAASTATTVTTPTAATGAAQTLNQNDFLQLLVKQIQYQDPMNPQSDTQMAAQMAQFTALQQSSQMSSSLSMLQANSLVGSTVSVQVDPSSKAIATGVVSGVTMDNGTPQIIINGTPYKMSQVLSLTSNLNTATATTSNGN